MADYKLGNRIDCVVRAYNATPIGIYPITYNNQPYTIIHGEKGMINFKEKSADMVGRDRDGGYSTEKIDSFTIYNITLTNKILNLIYSKKEGFSITYNEKVLSDENKKIFLNKATDKEKKLVFVYYIDGVEAVLESAFSTLDGDEIEVEYENAWYEVVYEAITDNIFSLDRRNNIYVSLDIASISNTDDETSTTWIHIDKAVVKVVKSLYFNGNSNAVDLTFSVVNDDTTINYIAWED